MHHSIVQWIVLVQYFECSLYQFGTSTTRTYCTGTYTTHTMINSKSHWFGIVNLSIYPPRGERWIGLKRLRFKTRLIHIRFPLYCSFSWLIWNNCVSFDQQAKQWRRSRSATGRDSCSRVRACTKCAAGQCSGSARGTKAMCLPRSRLGFGPRVPSRCSRRTRCACDSRSSRAAFPAQTPPKATSTCASLIEIDTFLSVWCIH